MQRIMMPGLGLAPGLSCTTWAKNTPEIVLNEDYADYRGIT